jgi:hypothetical protein
MAKTPEPSKYSWTEPKSDFKAQYPYNNVTQTESGHFQEFDDTPGAERIRTQHRTGTYTELQADGTRVNKILGDNYEIVAKDNNVKISGICNITIVGDAVTTIEGNRYERVKGDYFLEVEGNYQKVVNKKVSITSGDDMSLIVGSATGQFILDAGDSFALNSDLTIDGSITAAAITSTGAVVAGTGIHAGVPGSLNPYAGISTLGGIAAGFPVAPTIPGMIEATVSVNAPLISGIVVTDIRGPMELIRLLYDMHYHIGNRGWPTSPPIPLM